MGNYDRQFEMDAGMAVSLPGDVVIVASASQMDPLRGDSGEQGFANPALVPMPSDAPLPSGLIDRARVLVLEIDPSNEGSLRRLSQVRAHRDDLPIIAAIENADVALVRTLIRQGIADIAVLPFDPGELSSQILDAKAKLASHVTANALAPVITVVRSSGGCGSTTVLTHLAAALAEQTAGARVCVVDLDLQSGEVASFLGLSPKASVINLLEAGERLDAELLRGAVSARSAGFSVIAAPEGITPLETVNVDQLLKLLTLARREFDWVLVDLPADWTNWALSLAMASSEILLVTDLSIASLRQARRRLDLLASVGVDRQKIAVVLNRVERRLFRTIGVEEVRQTLNCEVVASLSNEGGAMSSAQDEGMLISDVSHRSRFAADVRSLARSLVKEAGDLS